MLSKPNRSMPFLGAFSLVFATVLPSLRKIQVYRELRSPIHRSFYTALQRFRELTTLHLAHLELSSVGLIRRVVYSFPRIETLALSWVAFDKRSDDIISSGRASQRGIRLTTLHLMHINATTLRVLTSWLINSGLCTALRSLMV